MVRAVVAAFCLAASARGVSLGNGWEVEVGGDGALTGRRHRRRDAAGPRLGELQTRRGLLQRRLPRGPPGPGDQRALRQVHQDLHAPAGRLVQGRPAAAHRHQVHPLPRHGPGLPQPRRRPEMDRRQLLGPLRDGVPRGRGGRRPRGPRRPRGAPRPRAPPRRGGGPPAPRRGLVRPLVGRLRDALRHNPRALRGRAPAVLSRLSVCSLVLRPLRLAGGHDGSTSPRRSPPAPRSTARPPAPWPRCTSATARTSPCPGA